MGEATVLAVRIPTLFDEKEKRERSVWNRQFGDKVCVRAWRSGEIAWQERVAIEESGSLPLEHRRRNRLPSFQP
jgi:hypothetical protein